MDIYKIIREAKNTEEIISDEEINSLYSGVSEKAIFSIINSDDNELFSKISEFILKRREDYKIAKHDETFEDFFNEIRFGLKKIIKSDKRKTIDEYLELVSNITEKLQNIINTEENDPNSTLFRLFFNEYNTKQIFTWKNFKDTKKQFEKNHPLEGENIYNLKSFLEKNTNIEKIDNNTVFSKEQGTLSDKCIEKLIEKFS